MLPNIEMVMCRDECLHKLAPCAECSVEGLGCLAAHHARGLRGEVQVWSFDGIDYWWVGDVLWCAEQKNRDVTLTDEERFWARVFTAGLALIVLLEVGLCLFVMWFFLSGGVLW